MNDLKILTKRTWMLLLLSLVIVFGLVIFAGNYIKNASTWVQHPTNKHLYSNGRLLAAGTIYDRKGEVLFEKVDDSLKYHEDKTIRKATMHVIGDLNGNVISSVQVAFGEKLSGWNLISGAYRFNKSDGVRKKIELTLDADLCAAAYKALNGRNGTVGVYNYKTGEILCMVSTPTFDPQNKPDVEANPIKYEGVYINRLLSASYTPGSVFKLVTAGAAIDNLEDLDSKVYNCKGEVTINGDTVTCLSKHGEISFEKALAESCNVAFGEISLELGRNRLQKYAEKIGFNSSVDVDSINTAVGKIKLSDAEDVELAWAGIGQYTDTANPLNFMTYVGSIANEGVRVSPKILKKNDLISLLLDYTNIGKRIISAKTANELKSMMRYNVTEVYKEKNYQGLELCAKTGTAEVGSDKKPHAWFVGFMDRDDFPLAFVVVVENGGRGIQAAAPIAKTVLEYAVSN